MQSILGLPYDLLWPQALSSAAAFTFAFVFLYPLQTPLEHLIVYWVAPIAAAVFGGLAFRGYQQLCAEREKRQATTRQRQSRRKED